MQTAPVTRILNNIVKLLESNMQMLEELVTHYSLQEVEDCDASNTPLLNRENFIFTT